MPNSPNQTQPRDVVIFGTGRGADTARRYFQTDTPHRVVGYVVDREFRTVARFHDQPVVAVDEMVEAFPPGEVAAFAPFGSERMNAVRAEKYALLKSLGYNLMSYVHSSNRLAGRCEIGENCFILENQSINFDTAIGDDVVIWSGCQIGDRSRIADHVFMASHVVLNGDVSIGARAYLGSNCTISNGVHIGPRSFIGANALISKNTQEGSVHIVESTPPADIDSDRFVRLIRHRL